MAQRRMFSKTITESDEFLSMGTDVQNLYFHLGMQADDDGFVSPKRVMRMVGSAEDSLTHLIAKRFLIPFEDRVVVIRDWKENNYLRNDRYKPTVYQKEKALLNNDINGRYTIGIPNDNQWLTQVRLGKERKEEKALAENFEEKFMKQIDYEIEQEKKSGNSRKMTPAEKKLLIAVGVLWCNKVKAALSLEDDEIPYANFISKAKHTLFREKFTYQDFSDLFDYFLNSKIRDEDKISFGLCLSEAYTKKFKIARKNKQSRGLTFADVSGDIKL